LLLACARRKKGNDAIPLQIHLHPHSLDYELFFEEFIPRACMPSDYGGTMGSVQDLHEQHCREFIRLRDYFNADEAEANMSQ